MSKKHSGTEPHQHTTLREFLRWLYRRHKLRRQYARDSRRTFHHIQKWTVAVFLLLMTVTFTGAMIYTGLHGSAAQTVIPLAAPDQAAPIGNPALALDAVTCDVTVTIGT
jgi:hypothetical protein